MPSISRPASFPLALALLLALLVGIPFGGFLTTSSEFINDDGIFAVQTQATVASAFTTDSYTAAGYRGAPATVYRPLGILILALQKMGWGTNSTLPWHITSLLLHLLTTLALFTWLGRLGLSRTASFLSALAFGVSPLHAESVGWISAQFELSGALFIVCALVFAASSGFLSLLASPLCFFLALLCKEPYLATLPALILTALWAPPPQKSPAGDAPPPSLAPRIRAGLLTLLWILVLASWWNLRGAAGVTSTSPGTVSWPALLASSGGGLLRGLGLLGLVPAAGPPLHPPNAWEWGGALALLILGTAAVRRDVRALAPASLMAVALPGLLYGQWGMSAVADPDRYFYLAWAGTPALVAFAFGGSIPDSPGESPGRLRIRRLSVLILPLLLLMAGSTRRELTHWRSHRSQLDRLVETGRSSGYVYYLRGVEALKEGDPCAAIADASLCSSMSPSPNKKRQCDAVKSRAEALCASLPPTPLR